MTRRRLVGPADYARLCVEAYTQGKRPPASPTRVPFTRRAACFVSLKRGGGLLRGCIGTLEPAEADLGGEIARNALAAATRDPRFPPVTPDELADLSYSVDVLGIPEPASIEQLDPRRYGVIVCTGWRRGVLLPDLPGVDTVAAQVAIALEKAGIVAGEDYDVLRFTVTRYHESARSKASPGGESGASLDTGQDPPRG